MCRLTLFIYIHPHSFHIIILILQNLSKAPSLFQPVLPTSCRFPILSVPVYRECGSLNSNKVSIPTRIVRTRVFKLTGGRGDFYSITRGFLGNDNFVYDLGLWVETMFSFGSCTGISSFVVTLSTYFIYPSAGDCFSEKKSWNWQTSLSNFNVFGAL